MALRSTRSSRKGLPRARLLTDADEHTILSCGADPASLPYLTPKLTHKNLLLEDIKLYAANIIKQSMLSIGGDVAVHRSAVSGKVKTSDCLIMGDLRHYSRLVEKLKAQPGLEPIAEAIEQQVFQEQGGLMLKLCSKDYNWVKTPVIMGILNVTPDSFSDGGLWCDPGRALDHALEMVHQGADIIDIGGESSRPDASNIDDREEISRVIPVIKKLASKVSVPISIDTRKASVAESAVDAGACIINDISSLSHDSHMLDVARRTGAGLILMHMRGTPQTMQDDTSYHDIIREIYAYHETRINFCLDKGIDRFSILVDPGIGFGKNFEGNLRIIHHISEFRSLGVPVVLGHSRKSFIGSVLDTSGDERQKGTDAVSAWAIIQGVDVLRVHDVDSTRQIKGMLLAIEANV
jgi:dihydropteroate synthase